MTLKEAGLTEDKLIKMYETMLMARRLDERMWLLNRSGKFLYHFWTRTRNGTNWRCVCL